jgi:hypothetical protein
MTRLLAGRDEKAIGNILQMLHEAKDDSPYRKYMPPLAASPEEIDALKVYLGSLVGAPKEVAAIPAQK